MWWDSNLQPFVVHVIENINMTIEDNTFDFKVRDRLLEECKNADYDLHYNPNDNKVMMDMITYCSQGNEEEAILNLKTTKEFLRRIASIRYIFGFKIQLWCSRQKKKIIFHNQFPTQPEQGSLFHSYLANYLHQWYNP